MVRLLSALRLATRHSPLPPYLPPQPLLAYVVITPRLPCAVTLCFRVLRPPRRARRLDCNDCLPALWTCFVPFSRVCSLSRLPLFRTIVTYSLFPCFVFCVCYSTLS